MRSVLVGMSGGVDSALTAALLQRQGYDVTGVYCVMHEYAEPGRKDAERIADELGIRLLTEDLRERFRDTVVADFFEKYAHAMTPNPCILCNPTVKFRALCDCADRLGIEKIATGHYAAAVRDPQSGRYAIAAVADKDQSYMLYRLTQPQLQRVLFPLGGTVKTENRQQAERFGISVAEKPDSQEICFIQGESYADYIERERGMFPPGEFWLEEENRSVGTHRGLIRYTVGQRKNLGIALGTPVYVKQLDAVHNRVILSRRDITDCREITVSDPVFQAMDPTVTSFEAEAKIRYSARPAPCRVTVSGNRMKAEFLTPQRAATPGQSAVFYRDGTVLCGGIIEP